MNRRTLIGLVAGASSGIISTLLSAHREKYADRLTYTGIYYQEFERRYDPRLTYRQEIDSPAISEEMDTEWLTDETGRIIGVRSEFDATRGVGADAGVKVAIAGIGVVE